ncbi:MAG: pantetheine-phosphate adenylyltransferase [Lawsonella clevelandensis]
MRRAARLFDTVIVCVAHNPRKQGLYPVEERLDILQREFADVNNVEIDSFSGLLVDYCTRVHAKAVVKVSRSNQDYEYELPMAHVNKRLSGIDTIFLPTSPELNFISSSLVKKSCVSAVTLRILCHRQSSKNCSNECRVCRSSDTPSRFPPKTSGIRHTRSDHKKEKGRTRMSMFSKRSTNSSP